MPSRFRAKIREQVLNGELPGGMRMNEADLAAALGVSRTPVRNALSTLGAEGLLKYTPNSGYVVRSYTEKDLQDIFEVRALLHGAAARIAAERGLSQHHYEVLRGVIDEGDRLVAQGIWSDAVLVRWRDVNENFHDTLFEAADNAHLSATYRRAQHFPFAKELAWRRFDAGDMGRSQVDHTGIFEAVLNGRARVPMRSPASTTIASDGAWSSNGGCAKPNAS